MYLFGNEDVEIDKNLAMKWLAISAENGNDYARELINHSDSNNSAVLTNTVVSLLTNLGRIIEDDNCRSRKNISRADRKLLQAIQRKKREIGIKPGGLDLHYD